MCENTPLQVASLRVPPDTRAMSALTDRAPPGLFAAILAAGRSRRFGSQKLLAHFRDEALVSHAVRTAEAICGDRTLLIVGSDGAAVRASCAPLTGFFVVNDRYAEGMSSSIGAAVRALPAAASGLLLTLGDQPLVDAADLTRLAAAWGEKPECIVCSRFGAQLTPPTLFPRRFFSELQALDGDSGAREVIDRHAEGVIAVEMPHAALDVDTAMALQRLDSMT